jgi:hypothetical protein
VPLGKRSDKFNLGSAILPRRSRRGHRPLVGVRPSPGGGYTYTYPGFIDAEFNKVGTRRRYFQRKSDAQRDWDREVTYWQPIRSLCLAQQSEGFEIIRVSYLLEYLAKIRLPKEDIVKIRWGVKVWLRLDGPDYPVNALYLERERERLQNAIAQVYPAPNRSGTRRGCNGRINQVLKHLVKAGALPDGLVPLVTTDTPIPIRKASLTKNVPGFAALRRIVAFARWLCLSPFRSDRICGVVLLLYLKFNEFGLPHGSKLLVRDFSYPYLTLSPKGRGRWTRTIDVARYHRLLLPFLAGKPGDAYLFSMDAEGRVPFNWVRISEKYRAFCRDDTEKSFRLSDFTPAHRRSRKWGATRYGL